MKRAQKIILPHGNESGHDGGNTNRDNYSTIGLLLGVLMISIRGHRDGSLSIIMITIGGGVAVGGGGCLAVCGGGNTHRRVLAHRGDCVLRSDNSIRQVTKVNHSRCVSITKLRMPRTSSGIFHDIHLKTLFQELTKVRLDAKIGGHSTQDNTIDATLAKLEGQVVRLWAVDLVRRSHDNVVPGDVLLVLVQPVSTGALKSLKRQGTCTVKLSVQKKCGRL